jgi:hypothetical protein
MSGDVLGTETFVRLPDGAPLSGSVASIQYDSSAGWRWAWCRRGWLPGRISVVIRLTGHATLH